MEKQSCKLSEYARSDIVSRLRRGQPGKDIAKYYGISEAAVSYYRAMAGLPRGKRQYSVEIVRRGGNRVWKKMGGYKLSQEQKDSIYRCLTDGASYVPIAKRFRVSKQLIGYYAKKFGFSRNRPHTVLLRRTSNRVNSEQDRAMIELVMRGV